MKIIFFTLPFLLLASYVIGQKIAVANDKNNTLYIGIDNPLSIAAENIPFNSLVVKATQGKIRKEGEKYIYHIDSGIGRVDIILYRKIKNQLKELGRSEFRTKRCPLPIFNVGSGAKRVTAAELSQQQFARAEWMNIDIDAAFPIEKFIVQVISTDSSRAVSKINYGNRISEEIIQAFKLLKPGDVVIFRDILTI